MLIPAPARVAPNRPMKPGLSWFVTYSMCGAKSAATLMPLISTMRGRDPANSVPETDRVSSPVCTVTRTSVRYSVGRSCTVSATSMPWSRAATDALTMLTPSISGDIRPANVAAVSGRWFRPATWPSYSIETLLIAPSLA